MSADLSGIDPLVYESRINVPYHWWAGDTASRFLCSIRDERKILGLRCDGCQKVYVPPRKNCPTCFTPNTNWVEVGPEGTVVTYTVARRRLRAIRDDVPVVFALVRLDGADTALLHRLRDVDPSRVSSGMRVKPRFAEDRQGRITDLDGFVPV
ncbi:MAG: Zn-ribbon domain-containing OB-fold protein [Desulfatibacillaceae bacterium]